MCALLGVFLLARPLIAADFLLKPEAAKILNLWGLIGGGFLGRPHGPLPAVLLFPRKGAGSRLAAS